MEARVGVVTIELSIPGARSLKEKRGRLRPLVDGIRHRFHVSIAEIGLMNVHDRAVVACAVVGRESRVLERVMAEIAKAAEDYDVRIDDLATEVI